MYIETAYARREALSYADLERLHAALVDETERYRFAIRNYPADRMEKYGTPFLAKLEARVSEVEQLLKQRLSS